MSANYGWVCPTCGSVYAPFVWKCQTCPPTITVGATSINLTASGNIAVETEREEAINEINREAPDERD